MLQLGHHTPHKISASSGFKAFLCSTLAFFIVAMASHLQDCCTCFSLVIIHHIKYLHPLVSKPFCAAPLPSSLLVAKASHLQLCSIEDFGKRPYSFVQCYTCAVTQGKKKLIQWELSGRLLIVARASAWSSYSTKNICILWFQSLSVQHPCLLHCCHGVSFARLLHVLQLGHHTPHKISASSGFKAFLCSTLAFFIVAMASHLQLCSIEDFGKRPYSFVQCYTCAVTHW